jgi:2-oxoglutarate ferredoxin oxidoreductase subunit alpha
VASQAQSKALAYTQGELADATRSRRWLSETVEVDWPDEERRFMPGNEALAEAAIRAGCRFFAGYPITPSTEILEHMAKRLPEVGGVCMFPGTEIEGITMAQGAAGAGVRAMTASTSTAFSLMQETIAECANGQWPVVIVNMCRGALQGDYYQTVKGGGHGDYQPIVLAPQNGQEMVDLTQDAFWLAERYRHPVLIFGDSVLAHVTETVVFRRRDEPELPEKTWATDATPGRSRRGVSYLGHTGLSTDIAHGVLRGLEKLDLIAQHEVRYETGFLDDAEVVAVAFGTAARYAKYAILEMRKKGVKIGYFRPITLSPYPSGALHEVAAGRKAIICLELNNGQMIHDVRSAVFGAAPVYAPRLGVQGRGFGDAPSVAELVQAFTAVAAEAGKKEARQS